MNILLHDFGSYIQPDLILCLTERGHHCKNLIYPLTNPFEDDYFEKYVSAHLSEGRYDCVMSTNFQPILAKICGDHAVKYLAWSYDSPLSAAYREYYACPTTFLFLFDRSESETLRNAGFQNVYHLPLAVNTKRLSAIPISQTDRQRFSCDVSFVGKIYRSPLQEILSRLDGYTAGYISALTDAQFHLGGLSLIEELIDDTLLEHINHILASRGVGCHPTGNAGIDPSTLILYIGNQITRRERILLLHLMNQFCKVHFYSTERVEQLPDIPFFGPVTYCQDMPKVFRLSRINLCPTLRCIRTGIPLRALDIIGSRGFLLCNPQPELMEYFRPNVDIAYYDSMDDAVEKVKFYLSHEDIRARLTQNAYAVVSEYFTYPQRIQYMFRTAGL